MTGNLVQRNANTTLAERQGVEHFIVLVDTSGSMRRLAEGFPSIHGEFLDSLAAEHPNAVVSCYTFDEKPYEQYEKVPIQSAPCLAMKPRLGTDLPNALLGGIGIDDLEAGDTVVIITDGDVEPHHSNHTVYETKRAVRRAKGWGARFLFLIAGEGRKRGVAEASRIGIDEDEVLTWEHSPEGIRAALAEATLILNPTLAAADWEGDRL